MFDLNERIASWRAEREQDLHTEAMAELEEHLRSEIEALAAIGLAEEEAFLVADRRLGTPREIAREFAKVDPAARWRKRAEWMVLGALALQVVHASFDMAVTLSALVSVSFGVGTWGTVALHVLALLPVLAGVVVVGRRVARSPAPFGEHVVRAAVALVAAGGLLWIGQRVLWVLSTRLVTAEDFGRMALSRTYASWLAGLLLMALLLGSLPWLERRRRAQSAEDRAALS